MKHSEFVIRFWCLSANRASFSRAQRASASALDRNAPHSAAFLQASLLSCPCFEQRGGVEVLGELCLQEMPLSRFELVLRLSARTAERSSVEAFPRTEEDLMSYVARLKE